jgi:site-specific DNA-methyltransferase (adenine-specific)
VSVEPYWTDGQVTLHLGDCLAVLPSLPDASIDAVVCDPPYGLADLPATMVLGALATWLAGDRAHVPDGRGGFMGRDWDRFVPPPAAWDECFRILKPGGHLLAFAGPRTVDLMTLSIRLARFEIRDSIAWLFAQGMPKSLDVSKAIDKVAGATRPVVASGKPVKRMIPGADQHRTGSWIKDNGRQFVPEVTEAATEDAARWAGWGTGLKPAMEPIVVARKPLAGTVVATVLAYSTGALNVDGCRVAHASPADLAESEGKNRHTDFGSGPRQHKGTYQGQPANDRAQYDGSAGRWPPNVLLTHAGGCEPAGTLLVRGDRREGGQGQRPGGFGDVGADTGDPQPNGPLYGDSEVQLWDCEPGCPVAELDRQSGHLRSGDVAGSTRHTVGGNGVTHGAMTGVIGQSFADSGGASRFFPVFRYQAKAGTAERPRLADGTSWPTVKPLPLIRWLVRLVTPPGGLVLDPYAGTGPTGEACIVEGFRCILIDRDAKAVELIRTRLGKDIQPDMFGGVAS